jgi:multidrug efflux pump subunit AcrA (membrane-fusion protein)
MKTLLCLFLTAASAMVTAQTKRPDTIILEEIAIKNLRLETVEVQETEFEETVFALGRIEVLPGKSAIVSTRVSGRVVSVSVERDHPVEKGAEVVRIESRQPGEPPPTVRIDAPISGLVAKLDAVPGQPVSPDSQLMHIVDLTEVHAIARVPEHLAGALTKGKKAHIRVSSYPDKTFEAELEHIGSLADAETATVGAFFHVANPEMLLRPGMRAEFSIVTSTRGGVMTVPREAVQGDASGRFVYVADYELKNAFVKIPVQLGAQNDRFIEITSGLLPGDKVVTRGAYALGFAGKGSVSLKEAMDAAHGHPHNEDGSEMTPEQRAAASGAGQTHGSTRAFTPLTAFFAGTSALLLVLLVVRSSAFRRKGASNSG